MLSSHSSSDLVCSVDILNNSETPKNLGLSSTITQALGEILTSHSVNAYRASMVISGEVPGIRSITISTFLAVLSTTFFTLICPFSVAFMMLSIIEVVVTPYGNWVIISVDLSTCSILARTFTRPPLSPSLYSLTSIIPPV